MAATYNFPTNNTKSFETFIITPKTNSNDPLSSLLESLSINQTNGDATTSKLLDISDIVGTVGNTKLKSKHSEFKFVLLGEESNDNTVVKIVFCPKSKQTIVFVENKLPVEFDESSAYSVSINAKFSLVGSAYDTGVAFVDSHLYGSVIDFDITELAKEMLQKAKSSPSAAISPLEVKLEVTRALGKIFKIHLFPTEIILALLKPLPLGDARSLLQAVPGLKEFRPVLKEIAEERIYRAFKPFFKSPAGFSRILKKTHSVVGGSTILHILSPSTKWSPQDMDVIVPVKSSLEVQAYLYENGFKIGFKDFAQGYDGYTEPSFMYTYFEKDEKNGEKRSIDLCTVMHTRARDHILHSSVVMNYFDGHKITCLYPDFTFSNLLLFNLYVVDTAQKNAPLAVAKYIKRGYLPFNMPYAREEGIFSIQELPKNTNESTSKMKAKIAKNVAGFLDIWGIQEDHMIIEEEVIGKWCLVVHVKDKIAEKTW